MLCRDALPFGESLLAEKGSCGTDIEKLSMTDEWLGDDEQKHRLSLSLLTRLCGVKKKFKLRGSTKVF